MEIYKAGLQYQIAEKNSPGIKLEIVLQATVYLQVAPVHQKPPRPPSLHHLHLQYRGEICCSRRRSLCYRHDELFVDGAIDEGVEVF